LKEARMTASDWNWALAIVGTVASIAGVVFSWMAWIQAAKAKTAARDAANAIRKRNTAHEVSKLAGDAKDFLSAVQQGRTENAIFAANNLIHELSTIRTWRIVSSSDRDKLEMCVGDIVQVATRLTVDGIPEFGPGFADLVALGHRIHRTVCDLAGRMERLSEGVSP
jgi:hypothetical protein